MRFYPRSLTGQIAILITLALFAAQAINLALLVRERRELRLEQAIRPSVVRLVDAAERLNSGRTVPGPERPWGERGSPRLLPANPIAPGLETVPEAEEAVAAALSDARIAHGRIVSGIRGIASDDRRLIHVDTRHAQRMLRKHRDLVVAVELPGRGWLSVRASWARGGWDLVARLMWQTLILYGVILLPALWLGRRIARPLRQLTVAARGFGRADNGAPLAESGPEDVRSLIAAFNSLSRRVHGMLEEKDRMLGAIGHDLRTPLAALRVRIESVEDDGDRARMADTIDEMNRTLDDILSLARLGRPSEPATDVDLTALVDAVVDDFRDLGAPVTIADAPRVIHTLRPVLMRRAVRNLIENAIRYGGGAEVSVVKASDADSICIADRGPGIPVAQLERVFDPFARLEEARNSETGGTGLGLALARGIVRDAGGEIILRNRDGGGLLAEIRLPAA